ncbi:jg24338 [Pararge aegeria aegeria]|uniref:Jg24338 protein n=1 Tax=Pararge aegeria aegeria TaxID=348720 RepID=A0A8S4S876_9NEOP|nr:jg24338 [Pararge aegeria aegeria]
MDLRAQKFVENLLSGDACQEPADSVKVEDLEMKLPEWFDEKKYNQGSRFYRDFLFMMSAAMVAGVIVLFAVPSIIKVLISTRRSSSVYTAYKRYFSTHKHVNSWFEHELKPDSVSWRSLHAVRSRHIQAGRAARLKGAGIVSQRDVALTLFGFIGFMFLKPDKFSVRQIKKGDWDAYNHCWKVIGHMIGLEDRYNICQDTYEETRQVCQILQDRVFTPCLENVPEYFEHMSRVTLEGLTNVMAIIEPTSMMYTVRYLANVPGYIYTEEDRIDFQIKLRKHLVNGKYSDEGVPSTKLVQECAIEGVMKREPHLHYIHDYDCLDDIPGYKQLPLIGKYRLAYNSIAIAFYATNIGRIIINFHLRCTLFIATYIPYLALCSFGGYLTVQDAPYNTPIGAAFLQAGEEMGYDIIDVNGLQQTGYAWYQFTMRRGTRCSAAKAFLRPVRLRQNLHISLFSHVTKVLIDPEKKRAYGVEFIRDTEKQVIYAKREVILAAGAIASPHLLMLSGVGPASHLKEVGINVIYDSPGVGRNLQDHIAVGGIVFQVDYPISLVMNRLVNINSALRYAVTEDGPLTSSIGLEVVAFINTKYANATEDWPDIEFMMTSASVPSDGGTQVKKAHSLTDEFYEEMFGHISNKDVFGIFPMMLRPKSRGFIKLRSKNPLEYPIMIHNYLTHPDDVGVLREGVKAALAVAETKAMKRLGARFNNKPIPNCKHLPLYTDEYWDCYIRQYTMTIYHLSCTAKMGPSSDPMAVVDSELRVYGIEGLRVIDASIMPAVTNGNINAPVIMIAEKGSDLIKDTWIPKTNKRSRRSLKCSKLERLFSKTMNAKCSVDR